MAKLKTKLTEKRTKRIYLKTSIGIHGDLIIEIYSERERNLPFLSFYCIILYIFVFQMNQSIHSMDKHMNRIKEVLEEKGIKQTWLAEKLGKSFCIVNSYVCNRRQPSLEVLFEIAQILQVDPKELIKSTHSTYGTPN